MTRLSLELHLKEKHEQKLAAWGQHDRAVFAQACRVFSISNNDANFAAVRGALAPGFELDEIRQVIQSNQFQFASATQAELQQWDDLERAELAEKVVDSLHGQLTMKILGRAAYPGETFEPSNRGKNVERLKQLYVGNLRQMAAVADHNHAIKQQFAAPTQQLARPQLKSPAMQQLESELARGYEKDVLVGGKPPLPKLWRNPDDSTIPLDANFIRRANRQTYSVMAQKWGYSQLTARLYGIKQIGDYVFEGEI